MSGGNPDHIHAIILHNLEPGPRRKCFQFPLPWLK